MKFNQADINNTTGNIMKNLTESNEIKIKKTILVEKDNISIKDDIVTNKKTESKLEEYNEGTDFGKYTRLVNEIKLQAEENGYKLSDKDIKKIADKMVNEDNFFYDYELPNPDDFDDESWEEIHNVINSYLKPNKIEEKYNVYTLAGEDGVYNSHKVDTVDTIEQAEDRVAELRAETGENAYYDVADDWWEENRDRIIKYVSNEDPQVLSDMLYDGDIDMYMQTKAKEKALDMYNQLGKDEVEKILNKFEKSSLKEANSTVNPEITNPEFWWLDQDTFVMQFGYSRDDDGWYNYMVEYWKDEDTYHFLKVYDYDTINVEFSEEKKNEIIEMMEKKMNTNKMEESININDKVKIVNSNDLHNGKEGKVTYIDNDTITVRLNNGRAFNYDKNQVQKLKESLTSVEDIVNGFEPWLKNIGLSIEEADKDLLNQYISEGPFMDVDTEEDMEILDQAEDELNKKYKDLPEADYSDDILEENATEKQYDATEIDRDLFLSLMKFNFGIDSKGNNYIITADGNDIKRFYAKNDEEAKKIYSAFKTDWNKSDHSDLTMKVKKIVESSLKEYYRLSDDEHIIWDSEVNYYDDDYMQDVKETQYQDYLNELEDGEEPEEFETWYDSYVTDQQELGDDWEILYDDLKENIYPAIDKQLNDDILLLSGGYNSNYPDFRSSGGGAILFDKGAEDFDKIIGDYDRIAITSTDGVLGAICADHDGTVVGQFYTLPDDRTELYKALDMEARVREEYSEEDIDKYNMNDLIEDEFNSLIYYGGIDARDLNEHLDLLKPVNDTVSSYGNMTESIDNTNSDIKYYNKDIILDEFKNWCDKQLYNIDEITETEMDEFLARKWIAIEKDIQDEDAARHIIYNLRRMLKDILIKHNYMSESEQLKEEYEVRQDYYDPETGEATRNEYVQSFDTWEEAQRFADGLAQDPNCTAWVNDVKKESKITEAEDMSKVKSNIEFNKVYKNKSQGLSRSAYFKSKEDLLKFAKENNIREYNFGNLEDIYYINYDRKYDKNVNQKDKSKVISPDDLVKQYKQDIYEIIYEFNQKSVPTEIKKQINEINSENRLTDTDKKELLDYIDLKLKDKGIKLTEAEDMTKVRKDIEKAKEKSDNKDLEKNQIKGSLDVLKTDEEEAIDGYDSFMKDTKKITSKKLSKALDNQMQEIKNDEEEHIEKLDTIKKALGESEEVTSVPYKTEKEAKAGVRSLKKAGFEARIEKQDDGTFVVISKNKKALGESEESNTNNNVIVEIALVQYDKNGEYDYTIESNYKTFNNEKDAMKFIKDNLEKNYEFYLYKSQKDIDNNDYYDVVVSNDVFNSKIQPDDFDIDILNFLLDNNIITSAEYNNMENVENWKELYDKGFEKAQELGDEEMAFNIAQDMNYLFYKERNRTMLESVKSKNTIKEKINITDLEDLAMKIFDWYDSDMGTHFDEIQGNKEEVYYDILGTLETKDKNIIDIYIQDMKDDESMKQVITQLRNLKKGKRK